MPKDIFAVFEESGSEIIGLVNRQLRKLVNDSLDSTSAFATSLVRNTAVDSITIQDRDTKIVKVQRSIAPTLPSVKQVIGAINKYLVELLIKRYGLEPDEARRARIGSWTVMGQKTPCLNVQTYHKEAGGNCLTCSMRGC